MIIISLGSNVTSRWGNSPSTIKRALSELEAHGISVLKRSSLYSTTPYGIRNQPDFINCAAILYTPIPPKALLLLLKKIEESAGRRPAQRWGPRPLDLDIIDYKKRILHQRKLTKTRGKYGVSGDANLTLPHPGVVSRIFVLQPIAEMAPFWHHPVTGLTAAQMMQPLRFAKDGSILQRIGDAEALD